MSKLVPSKRLGVPVPAIVGDIVAVVVYYNSAGQAPTYDQAARLVLPIADLERRAIGDASFFVVDSAALPALPEGDYSFSFTFQDDVGNESDFSPVVTVPLDREAPAAPGTPILLD